MKIDLTWGESVAVRQAFTEQLKLKTLLLTNNLNDLNYSPFEGDAELLAHTRQVIKRQSGKDYRHVLLTNGAAGGCVITMRAYYQQGKTIGLTWPAPYFSIYPNMIAASGLEHMIEGHSMGIDVMKSVHLVDSPSNPEGIVRGGRDFMPVIWDSVYGNKVYARFNRVIPHDVYVGSYSKLTGLNGIRIGWIATDDSLLYERLKTLVTAEYCGLSTASVMILNKVLPDYDWARFEGKALDALDQNKTEWQKLEKFFGGQAVPDNGMFYYGPMDADAQELFYKAGIVWTPSTRLGTAKDDHGRFNIGQSYNLIKKAVDEVLKADTLR